MRNGLDDRFSVTLGKQHERNFRRGGGRRGGFAVADETQSFEPDAESARTVMDRFRSCFLTASVSPPITSTTVVIGPTREERRD